MLRPEIHSVADDQDGWTWALLCEPPEYAQRGASVDPLLPQDAHRPLDTPHCGERGPAKRRFCLPEVATKRDAVLVVAIFGVQCARSRREGGPGVDRGDFGRGVDQGDLQGQLDRNRRATGAGSDVAVVSWGPRRRETGYLGERCGAGGTARPGSRVAAAGPRGVLSTGPVAADGRDQARSLCWCQWTGRCGCRRWLAVPGN